MNDADTIHVIGGGLAGLTAAAFVARAGVPVVVHESAGTPGGRARTDERDGYRFNRGPHALYAGGAGHRILGELGIRPSGRQPDVGGAAVFEGRCHRGPFTTTGLLRTDLFGTSEKARLGSFLAGIGRIKAEEHAHRSVAEWVDGAVRGALARATLHALVRLTTYANAPETLSAQVAIEQIQMGIKPGVLYLDDGWAQLVHALAAQPGVQIRTRSRMSELPDAAAVIVAAGDAASTGQLIGYQFEVGPPADAACLDLGLNREPPWSFALGVDAPMYASKHSIGARHAPEGGSTLILAEYLAAGSEPDRDRLEAYAATIGIRGEMVATQRYLHRMTAVSAIPTAEAGGLAGRPGVRIPGLPGVFLAGDWVGPEGHLADASMASAQAAASAAVAHVESRTPVG